MIPCAFALKNEIYTHRTALLVRFLVFRAVKNTTRASKLEFVEKMAEHIGVSASTINVYCNYKPNIKRTLKPTKLHIVLGICHHLKVDIALFFHVVVNDALYPDMNEVVDDMLRGRLFLSANYSPGSVDELIQNSQAKIKSVDNNESAVTKDGQSRFGHSDSVEPYIVYVRDGHSETGATYNPR